jgi:hypothetical protein
MGPGASTTEKSCPGLQQYDVLGLGRSVSAHASCHQVWRAEADKLRLRTNPKLRQGKGEAS